MLHFNISLGDPVRRRRPGSCANVEPERGIVGKALPESLALTALVHTLTYIKRG